MKMNKKIKIKLMFIMVKPSNYNNRIKVTA